jgi:dihydropyrimidinase
MSILIRGGRVVTATDVATADVLVEGETIAAIGRDLDAGADTVIDARGRYVLPGAIDVHTHLDIEGSSDDFTSGTVAAAFGGTTCVIDFCFQERGGTLREALAAWHAKLAAAPPVVDVGFHMTVVDLAVPGALDDLAWLCDEGVTSYKIFLAYPESVMVDDETLFRTLLAGAENRALTLVHAENGGAIEVLRQRAQAAGNTEPRWHARTRPRETEGEATGRALDLAAVAGAPVYIVHMSCGEALEPLARARAAGRAAWGETCPQYLFTEEEGLDEPDFGGAKYVFTPPPRAREDQEALWRALATGLLSVVSTDHCPYDLAGAKQLGRDDFTLIPQGAPGIEHRLHLLHHHGVAAGRLSLPQLVELTATNPARLFGLHPRKGTIAVGSDADLVVFDPEKRVTISAAAQHSRVDYTLYEGQDVVGAPEVVLLRGRVVVEGDRLVASPGSGRFVARARFGEELTPASAVAA